MREQKPTSRRSLLAALGTLITTSAAGCLRLTNEDSAMAGSGAEETTEQSTTQGEATSIDDQSDSNDERLNRRTSGSDTVSQIFVDTQNRMYQRGATVTSSKPPLAWKQDLEIDYYSRIAQGPLISGDHLFLASRQDLVAVSRSDGSITWRFSDTTVDAYRVYRPSLALTNGVLVTAMRNHRTSDWEVLGINPADGQQQWNVELSLDESIDEHVTGFKIAGDWAYLGTNTRADDGISKLYAVDLKDHRVDWTAPLADGNLHPEDFAIVDDTAFITTDEAPPDMANIIAFDLTARERSWETTLPIGEGIPVVDDTNVYLPVQTEEGKDHIVALSRTDGSITWQFEQLNAPRTGVTVDDEYVYTVADERLYALSPVDGSPVWSFKTKDGSQMTGSSEGLPVVTENLIMTGAWTPGGARIRAVDKVTGDLEWTYDVPQGTVTSPFVADDTLWTIGYNRQDDGPITLYALGGHPS